MMQLLHKRGLTCLSGINLAWERASELVEQEQV